MIGRHSARDRAVQLDLSYVQAPPVHRRVLRALMFTAPVLAALWVVSMTRLYHDAIYNCGPVSISHAVFENQCGRCHLTWSPVADTRCVACHPSAGHHTTQIFQQVSGAAPRCASCHLEHKGRARLQEVPDEDCTQCHAQLETTEHKTEFSRSITAFGVDHPDLVVFQKRQTDTAAITFDHAAHMAPGLQGVRTFVQESVLAGRSTVRTALACTDCHQRDNSGGLMRPISYQRHCASCHPLTIEATWAIDAPPGQRDRAPHDTPQAIHGFLMARVSDAPALAGRIEEIEQTLFTRQRDGCVLCHTLSVAPDGPGGRRPYALRATVAPTRIPARWLMHARFDHAAHRAMTCVSCHSGATASHQAADVNLPSIKVCQGCHAPGRTPSACWVCHTYHDKTDLARSEGGLDGMSIDKQVPAH